MSDPLFEGDDDGNTPLETEEREQLIPSYITTRAELNEAELANIADAVRWVGRRKRKVLDQGFMNDLHKQMYGDVWKWAGTYRTTARNIGIDAYRIPVEYYQAIDDAKYWAEHSTFPPDEIAIRFSHRVVAIHPYGSLLEISRSGQQPVTLPGGETRAFLEDGDEVIMTARADAEGFVPIGFGNCRAVILPAPEAS